MKSYTFKVVLERDKWPDEPDEKAVWRAYVPCLEGKGGASWGGVSQVPARDPHESDRPCAHPARLSLQPRIGLTLLDLSLPIS
jgi:hypothetical protein